jgi:hypothetical protein
MAGKLRYFAALLICLSPGLSSAGNGCISVIRNQDRKEFFEDFSITGQCDLNGHTYTNDILQSDIRLDKPTFYPSYTINVLKKAFYADAGFSNDAFCADIKNYKS